MKTRLLSIGAIVSVLVAVASLTLWFIESHNRREDNIDNDLFACNRVNVLRGEVRNLAIDLTTLDQNVLETIYPFVDNQELIETIDRQLDPLFQEINNKIQSIENVDCTELIGVEDE